MPWWSYLQVRHFLTTKQTTGDYAREMTSFETLCMANSPRSHLVSKLYADLTEASLTKIDNIRKGWESELGVEWDDEE